jgi:hypothetical protein
MSKVKASFILLLALAFFGANATAKRAAAPLQKSEPWRGQEQRIKMTIATVSPALDGLTTTYRLGQQIPVAINLTNTATEPVYLCLSGDLYQDLPQLRRDGHLLPYTNWQTYLLQSSAKNLSCLNDDLPDSTLLLPNEPTLVDSLIVVDDRDDPTGALAWYDQLPSGHYELSVQRRLGCCEGPMVESNKIDFDITP